MDPKKIVVHVTGGAHDDFPEDDDPFGMNEPGTVEFLLLGYDRYGNPEVDIEEYTGCAAWLQEGVGLGYFVTEYVMPHKDRRYITGCRYVVRGITVHYTPAVTWRESPAPMDADEDYEWEQVTAHVYPWEWVTVSMRHWYWSIRERLGYYE